jgi:hypothetical protein
MPSTRTCGVRYPPLLAPTTRATVRAIPASQQQARDISVPKSVRRTVAAAGNERERQRSVRSRPGGGRPVSWICEWAISAWRKPVGDIVAVPVRVLARCRPTGRLQATHEQPGRRNTPRAAGSAATKLPAPPPARQPRGSPRTPDSPAAPDPPNNGRAPSSPPEAKPPRSPAPALSTALRASLASHKQTHRSTGTREVRTRQIARKRRRIVATAATRCGGVGARRASRRRAARCE